MFIAILKSEFSIWNFNVSDNFAWYSIRKIKENFIVSQLSSVDEKSIRTQQYKLV